MVIAYINSGFWKTGEKENEKTNNYRNLHDRRHIFTYADIPDNRIFFV
jgi:hypothetical protein